MVLDFEKSMRVITWSISDNNCQSKSRSNSSASGAPGTANILFANERNSINVHTVNRIMLPIISNVKLVQKNSVMEISTKLSCDKWQCIKLPKIN